MNFFYKAILYMMKQLVCLFVFLAASMLAGCGVSSIHPPSAATFMEKSDGAFLKSVSGSLYWGDLAYGGLGVDFVPNKEIKKEVNDDWAYAEREVPVDIMLEIQRSIGYFKFGGGLDFLTPYLQIGFVSDYLGVMGWSNLWLWQLEKVEHKYFQWGGGLSLIEQLPIGDSFRMGLTQHLSRNGRHAHVYTNHGKMNLGRHACAFDAGIACTHDTPIFYDEIGGGGYISFVPRETLRFGLEFRYGRDLTYKRKDYSNYPEKYEKFSNMDRFVLTISVMGW